MAQIKLAEYTFDNSVGDCLPTLTPNTITMTKEDSVNGTITTAIVYIDDSILPTGISFSDKTNLLTVNYLRIDSNIKSIPNLFRNCSSLTYVELSPISTENITSIASMFYNCSALTTLDLSNWKVDKVTNMSNVFNGC